MSNDRTLKIWDQYTLNLLYSYTDSCQLKVSVQINQTSFMVATSCEQFRMLNIYTDSIRTLAYVTNSFNFNSLPNALIQFNSTIVILGTSNGTIQIFDLNSNSSSFVQMIDEKSAVNALCAINKDLFASGLNAINLNIWNLTNSSRVASLYQGNFIFSVIISNDKKYLISSDFFFKIMLWNTSNWALFKRIDIAAFKMVQLNDDLIVNARTANTSIGIGLFVTNITNSTVNYTSFTKINSIYYYSMAKLDNNFVVLGANGDVELWDLKDLSKPRLVKNRIKGHTIIVTDVENYKGNYLF